MNREMVLYYTPADTPNVAKLKGVLMRMGVRIKNISAEQTGQTIGYLAGLPGFPCRKCASDTLPVFEETKQPEAESAVTVPIPCEVLVMHNFTSRRIDELLLNLRKAGAPRIALKAVVTEHNSHWTFYHLYEEIKKEHEAMTPSAARTE